MPKPAALSVALGILASRLAGLVRERVIAHYLGNSDAAGAFRAALRIPNLLQNLFGEGVLSASFIPVYARLLEEGREEEAGRVAGVTFTLLALAVSACALVGIAGSRTIIGLLAPGFTGDIRETTIQLVQIMFPGTALLVLSAWCLGILNSHRKFFLSYVAPVFWNVAMIALLFAVGARYMDDRSGQMRLAALLAWATVAGALLQLLVQLPSALALNRGLLPGLGARTEHMRLVLANFLPAVLTRGVVQLSAYVDQILASFLGAQIVSALAYAQTIYLLPVSLFGMSISSAELPEMARTAGTAEEKAAALKQRLERGLRRLAFFIVPSAVALLVLGRVIAATLLETGNFRAADSALVWMILAGSSIGLLATTKARLCTSLFWALHDARTPARYAFVRVVTAGAVGGLLVFAFRDRLGGAGCAAGLTAASSLSGWLEYMLIRRALEARVGPIERPGLPSLRPWAAAFLAGAAGWALDAALPRPHPALRGLSILGVYSLLYIGAMLASGDEDARDAVGGVRSRLGL
ncbi:MAG: murein biosynthesis integral membrane protein MurJ [Elusimicrobia bacterium]|nr:murein biosynthesis integral membrane protein MurJ [Elusimicrobiota bacterium]